MEDAKTTVAEPLVETTRRRRAADGSRPKRQPR